MTGLTIVFRTRSQIEADVVRGLLESHGVAAMISSDLSSTPFPLSVSEIQVQVAADDAEHAERIIEKLRNPRD